LFILIVGVINLPTAWCLQPVVKRILTSLLISVFLGNLIPWFIFHGALPKVHPRFLDLVAVAFPLEVTTLLAVLVGILVRGRGKEEQRKVKVHVDFWEKDELLGTTNICVGRADHVLPFDWSEFDKVVSNWTKENNQVIIRKEWSWARVSPWLGLVFPDEMQLNVVVRPDSVKWYPQKGDYEGTERERAVWQTGDESPDDE